MRRQHLGRNEKIEGYLIRRWGWENLVEGRLRESGKMSRHPLRPSLCSRIVNSNLIQLEPANLVLLDWNQILFPHLYWNLTGLFLPGYRCSSGSALGLCLGMGHRYPDLLGVVEVCCQTFRIFSIGWMKDVGKCGLGEVGWGRKGLGVEGERLNISGVGIGSEDDRGRGNRWTTHVRAAEDEPVHAIFGINQMVLIARFSWREGRDFFPVSLRSVLLAEVSMSSERIR